jgi:integrase
MKASNRAGWKEAGIRVRQISNQTVHNGQRVSFGTSFQIIIPARLTGKGRLRRQFNTKKDAEDWAAEQLAGTKLIGQQFLELAPEERREAVAALDILRPFKLSLLTVATEYAQAHSKLAGRTLAEAVDYFTRHKPAGMPIKTVSEVHQDLIAAKRKDGVSAVYLKDLEFRNGNFADSFPCPIAELTAASVNDWLRKRKCGPRGRNNYRKSLKTLFSFAEAHDYITKGHVDFSKVAKAKEPASEIEIFTPHEMGKLLMAAQLNPEDLPPGYNKRYAGSLLPLLLLAGFAGLRTAEVERQRWEDINLERGFIRVTATKGNTAAKRLVPIAENLKAWFAPLRRDNGPVLEIARVPDAVARLAERAGVEWKHNALRHSFISYRVAITANVAQVSLEAGNSPVMIHRHYRELVGPEEARAWFSIAPATPANVALLRASNE